MEQDHPTRIVIIGAGLMGAAAAYHLSLLAREGSAKIQVTVLERGRKDQLTGSSAGESRISRKTSFENADVIPPMTVCSNAVLYALGAVESCRTVIVGNNPRYIDQAMKAAESSQVAHVPLADLAESVPYVNTAGLSGLVEAPMDASGDGAGIINPRLAVRRLLEKAEANHVTMRYETAVRSVVEHDGKVELTLDGGEILLADRVIAASGVWNDPFIGAATSGALLTKAKVLKVFWFKLKEEFDLGDFPNFIFKIKGGPEFAALHPRFATEHPGYDFRHATTEEGFYLLRERLPDGVFLKVGHYQPTPLIKEAPDVLLARETITPEHGAFVAGFVREFFPGLAAHLQQVDAPSFTKTYLESFANDTMPIVGPRTSGSRVIVMTGFSGIGAKFAVEAGVYAAMYALGQSESIPEKARALFAPNRESLRPKLPNSWRVNGRLGAPGPDGTVQSPPCLDLGLLGEKAAKLYRNGYPANAGIPEARVAVANLFNRYKADREMPGEDIDLEQVYLATGGATDAIQIAIDHARSKFAPTATPRTLLVIPIYHLYLGQLRENGFVSDYADSSDRFDEATNTLIPRTDEEVLADLRRQITPQTCLAFINSPRNPDGKVYSRSLLEGVLAILDENPSLRIVSDTIYKEVAAREENVLTLFGLATPPQRRRIYEVDGTSKSVAKTMDRAAWLLSAPENVAEIAAVSHLKRGRPALPQMLQIVSMDEYLDRSAPNYLQQNSAMYAGKMQYVGAAAAQVVGLHSSPHLGAYYGYLDFRAVDFGIPMTAREKENAMVDALTVAGIGVFAGSTFKHTGAIRFNCSFKNDTLRDLMEVIVETFEKLGAEVVRQNIPLPVIDVPDYDFRPYPTGILSTQQPAVLQKLQTAPTSGG